MHALRHWFLTSWSTPGQIRVAAGVSVVLALMFSAVQMTGPSPAVASPLVHRQPAYANPADLEAVSCPAAKFCVAVDHAGNVMSSVQPGTARSWHSVSVDGVTSLTSISCASTALCVATDHAGDAIVATKPTAGSSAWHLSHADDASNGFTATYPSDFLTSVSCPTETLCVAVDNRGNVVTSTDPSSPKPRWFTANVDGINDLSGVSCASSSLCVAIDLAGNVLVATDPAGGPGAWQVSAIADELSTMNAFPARLTGGFLSAVSCPSTTLCVIVDNQGYALTTDDAEGGAAAWSMSRVDLDAGLTALSCASASFCTAVDDRGYVVTSTSPASGTEGWDRVRVDRAGLLSGVSCVSPAQCLAVDLEGNVLSSANAAGSDAWTSPSSVDSAGNMRCFGAAERDPANTCRRAIDSAATVPAPNEALITPNAPCTVLERLDIAEICSFGVSPAAATGTVALLGDSHAQHWRAALEVVAQAKGWQGVSVTRSGCPFNAGPLSLTGKARDTCHRLMTTDVPKWLATQPQITTVFVSESELSVPHGRGMLATDARGYLEAWKALPRSVRHIIVIRDTPRIRQSTLACVEQQLERRRDPAQACAVPRVEALQRDPATIAASELGTGRVQIVDLTRFICGSNLCYPVVGGALVYKDFQHLTEVFSTTLGPYLLTAIDGLTAGWQ